MTELLTPFGGFVVLAMLGLLCLVAALAGWVGAGRQAGAIEELRLLGEQSLAAQRGDPYQVFYETDLKSPTCTDDKTLRTQRAAAAAFKATHGTPDVKVLHPRHEPDMVC